MCRSWSMSVIPSFRYRLNSPSGPSLPSSWSRSAIWSDPFSANLMRVLLTSEARFERTGDGTVWGPAAYGSALWNRYLDVFSDVVVAARVADVERPSDGCVVAST